MRKQTKTYDRYLASEPAATAPLIDGDNMEIHGERIRLHAGSTRPIAANSAEWRAGPGAAAGTRRAVVSGKFGRQFAT